MTGRQRRRFWMSRRFLLGAAVVGAGAAWTGTTLARLARGPSGAKSAGRIADIEGRALALGAPASKPVYDPALPWKMQGGTLNDASALSQTPVYGAVAVSEEKHVLDAIAF